MIQNDLENLAGGLMPSSRLLFHHDTDRQARPVRRLQRICKRLSYHPELEVTLAQHAAECALTERTAARLSLRDTGMTFGRWRQHMRLQRALEHLATGKRTA